MSEPNDLQGDHETEITLSKSQQPQWRIASNRMSVEAIKYAAKIVGYTDLTTATIVVLESLISGRASTNDCRALHLKAKKSTFRNEPLLDSILIALKWASSDGTGGFMVGNIVDPIYAMALNRGESNPDAETNKSLIEIHDRVLGPYYQQLQKSKPAKRK